MSSRVYVGGLPLNFRERDVEDLFYKYGRIARIDLKVGQRPPAFAFVEYTDPRDAMDAVRGRDGYNVDGYRIRVEIAKGPRSGSQASGGLRRSEHRVVVTGLPPSGSWQDLKDHMRRAGDVCHASVNRDGTGFVEFISYEDMRYAIDKLDDSEFRSHEGETATIRVKEDRSGGSGGSGSRGRGDYGDRGGDRDRDRRDRSPRRSRSPRRDRSPSPRRGRSPSPRRGRSPSPRRGRSPSPRRDRSASPQRDV